MSTATAEETGHRHIFKIRYRLVNGEITVHPICQCAGCEVKALITYEGSGIRVTFIDKGVRTTYHATLSEGA